MRLKVLNFYTVGKLLECWYNICYSCYFGHTHTHIHMLFIHTSLNAPIHYIYTCMLSMCSFHFMLLLGSVSPLILLYTISPLVLSYTINMYCIDGMCAYLHPIILSFISFSHAVGFIIIWSPLVYIYTTVLYCAYAICIPYAHVLGALFNCYSSPFF